MEFFQNIWAWVVQNKDGILMTITSVDLISLITAVVLLIKSLRSSKDNTKSTNTLNENISNISTLTATSEEMKVTVKDIKTTQTEQGKVLVEIIELQNLLTDKLNLLFEAQSQVWSTIKDDTIRTNVNTILTSAKHNETSTIVALKEEIAQLKTKLLSKTKELEKDIEVTIPETNVKKNKEVVKRV